MSTIEECMILQLPTVHNRQGNLTPIHSGVDLPFDIRRVYYLYDVPGGSNRGGHAHKELQQLIVAVMGAFDVVLDDGHRRKTVHLDRAYYGLYIPSMIWREIENFSSGGICLVLASLPYDESDYFRDYEEFVRSVKGGA